VRPIAPICAGTKLALTAALVACIGFSGCAWSRNRRTYVPFAPAKDIAPSAQVPDPSHKPDAQARETVAAPIAYAVRTASLAHASVLDQSQPEPVQPPPPSPSLPLAFSEGTTLDELEQLAADRHPKLMAAMQEIEAAHGRTWQAGRMPNPSVGASSPQIAGSDSQYNVFVTQEIPTGGKLRLNEAAAAEEIDQAELTLSRTRQDVLTSVRRHFYATLIAQARSKILQEQAATISRSVELVRKRFEGTGEGTKTDVLLLEVELQKADVALAGAHTDLEAQRRQLAAALGIPDYPIGDLAGDLQADVSLAGLDHLAERVVSEHPQAAIAANEIRRQQWLIDRAYAEPKPTFNVQGGYQRQVDPPQDQGILQLTMSVPLWDRNHGGIQAAEAQAMKAQAELARVETELASQAAAAYGRYAAAHDRVSRYRDKMLPQTVEALDLAMRLYREGETDFQTLLNAQRAAQEALVQYLDALSARWEAAIEIADLLQMERMP
jgi:cobalt-zinc-cadmium efflux system outer membrane protein